MDYSPQKIALFLKRRYAPRGAEISFSQTGEDLLIQSALKKMGVIKPLYIDIGAHHPIFGNNTYLFYKNGGQGIVIEPENFLYKLLKKKRPKDTVLRAGAGKVNTEENFFSFSQSTRNTFSKQQADQWETISGQKMTSEILPIFSLDTIITNYCINRIPDIVSIDAEGLDYEILSGFSWLVRPKIFCIETATTTDLVPQRNKNIYKIFNDHNYSLYAETPANSIFIDSTLK